MSLIERLYTTNSFNVGAMKSTFKNIWKLARGLIIKELDRNMFIFQFFSKADKDTVLNDGPWAFDGHTLLLKELTGFETYSDVVRLWIKVYDVPGLNKQRCLLNALRTRWVSLWELMRITWSEWINP